MGQIRGMTPASSSNSASTAQSPVAEASGLSKRRARVRPAPPPLNLASAMYCAHASRMQMWTTALPTPISSTTADFDICSMGSDGTHRSSFVPMSDYLQTPPLFLDVDDLDKDDISVGENSKLKGVFWPGMNIFDSATPEMRRKRNQKKAVSVLTQLETNSLEVEPTELVFTPAGSLKKVRKISGMPDSDSSPLIEPSPRRHPTRVSRRGRIPLADVDINIPEPSSSLFVHSEYPRYQLFSDRQSPTIQCKAEYSTSQTRQFNERYRYVDAGTPNPSNSIGDFSGVARKRKRPFGIYQDEVSFAQPAGLSCLTSAISYPDPFSPFAVDVSPYITANGDNEYWHWTEMDRDSRQSTTHSANRTYYENSSHSQHDCAQQCDDLLRNGFGGDGDVHAPPVIYPELSASFGPNLGSFYPQAKETFEQRTGDEDNSVGDNLPQPDSIVKTEDEEMINCQPDVAMMNLLPYPEILYSQNLQSERDEAVAATSNDISGIFDFHQLHDGVSATADRVHDCEFNNVGGFMGSQYIETGEMKPTVDRSTASTAFNHEYFSLQDAFSQDDTPKGPPQFVWPQETLSISARVYDEDDDDQTISAPPSER